MIVHSLVAAPFHPFVFHILGHKKFKALQETVRIILGDRDFRTCVLFKLLHCPIAVAPVYAGNVEVTPELPGIGTDAYSHECR